MIDTLKPTHKLACIAHRGGRKLGCENTLETISAALTLGVDAIEIDVWRVGDSLIVTHDRELGRVVIGDRRVSDLQAEEISALRHIDDSSVARLETVMELIGAQARLNIELKGPGCAELTAKMVNAFCQHNNIGIDNYIVSSFDHQQLHWLHQQAPNILRGVLFYGLALDGIDSCKKLNAYSYHPSVDFINPTLINEARHLGMEVWPYTANREDDFEELLAAGASGVFTDDPVLLKTFNQRQ